MKPKYRSLANEKNDRFIEGEDYKVEGKPIAECFMCVEFPLLRVRIYISKYVICVILCLFVYILCCFSVPLIRTRT